MEGLEDNIQNTVDNDYGQRRNLRAEIRQNSDPMKIKKRKRLITVTILLFIFTYFFVVRPYTKLRVKANELKKSAKELKSAFSKNDIDLVKKEMDEFAKEYKGFEKEARPLYIFAFIPYVSDFKNGIEAGDSLVAAGQEAINAIAPYADLIGFKKGESSFVEKSAEDRLQTAVFTLDKVLNRLDAISIHMKRAQEKIEKINPDRYPKRIGKRIIRDQVANIKDQIYGVSTLFVDAKPLLRELPTILGKNDEKTYLILFQNDKERRATGGFLTTYAIFKIKDGKIKISKTDDIYALDQTISHPPAPKEILAYHKGVSRFYIRDSNLSPDFIESLKLFNSLYGKSSDKVEYDGIIALDSHVLVDMLTIYGDTEANGVVFSAKEDKRCDCPQVIYQLFDIVDRPVNYVKTNRKGILGDLMYQLLYKALGFSPSKYWGTLSQTMFKNLEEKHVLLYFVDPRLQQSVEKLNFAGRVRNTQGDYLHINNVNFAGAKSNLFVTENIESRTKINSEGRIEREVTISYRNPYPHSDCNLERGGLCLNATLRNWIRVYVPQDSQLVEFKGSETNVKTYNELDKTVYEGFLRVNPLGSAKVIVTYTLPQVVSRKNYQILLQKQPGVDSQKLKVVIKGKTLYDGLFDKDKALKGSL